MPEKILIIDDNKDVCGELSDILSDSGYETVMICDSREALEKIEEIDPDLIVVDTVMPGIDGMEFCKEVKKKDSMKNVRIIVYTAKLDAIDTVAARKAGV